MSDNNHYSRSINPSGAASESFSADGDIASTTTVASGDTTAGDVTLALPGQVPAAGATVTVVKPVGANDLTIGVQTGESLDGAVDADVTLAAGAAYLSAVFVSTGASWAQIA